MLAPPSLSAPAPWSCSAVYGGCARLSVQPVGALRNMFCGRRQTVVKRSASEGPCGDDGTGHVLVRIIPNRCS